MAIENEAVMMEIRDLLRLLVDGQKELEQDIADLKAEHKKLKEEVRLSNYVMNNLNARAETVN